MINVKLPTHAHNEKLLKDVLRGETFLLGDDVYIASIGSCIRLKDGVKLCAGDMCTVTMVHCELTVTY